MTRATALLLTVLTGGSALVLEVAWQRALASLLGSHGEATAAVLGVFLGGLSLGYWLFGALTRRRIARAREAGRAANLLGLYGGVEVGVGLYVLAFPWLFRGVETLSFALGSTGGAAGFAVDVLLAALLIGPASILMGGTIPILTQALARSLADATHVHALVYACNTVGAFVGALGAGFYWIPELGLWNVIRTMGAVDLLAGAVFLVLGARARARSSAPPLETDSDAGGPAPGGPRVGAYAAVALLTGFAMMTVQTTVIRIASFSFGSSEFTFAMVVAVFVLGIALGSFAVSALRRIAPHALAIDQWALAITCGALYWRLPEAPYWAFMLRSVFRDTDAGFAAYWAASFLGVLLVLGLPVALSGAALPLLFHHLRQRLGHLGDLAGTLYGWNTVGSLLGALLGGYALLFWLDLHAVYRIAVGALALAAMIATVRAHGLHPAAWGLLIPIGVALAWVPAWAPDELYALLVGNRRAPSDAWAGPEAFYARARVDPRAGRILLHTDDPTASVVVREFLSEGTLPFRAIATNGKSDGDTLHDRPTTGLLAVLPAMFAKDLERAFVIGRGVGTTAGELASFDGILRVDVAEISRGVIQAAPLFDFATLGASANPRIRVIESDAYRALMRSREQYDVIVSAPSHAWVAGVEKLFSREFLASARKRLRAGGVYCQWLQQYEIDDASLALVLRTYASVYEHVAVWRGATGALLLLGFEDPALATDHFRLEGQAQRPDFRAALERSEIAGFPELLAHELLPVDVVNAARLSGPIHTLEHPRLGYLAGRAFFRGEAGELPFTGSGESARIGAKNSLLGRHLGRYHGTWPDDERARVVDQACRALGPRCFTLLAAWLLESPESPRLQAALARVLDAPGGTTRRRLAEIAALLSAAPVAPGDFVDPERAERATRDFASFYHHARPFREAALRAIWSSCRDGTPSEAECRTRVQAQYALGRPDATTPDEALQACLATPTVGPRCAAGVEAARRLLGNEASE